MERRILVLIGLGLIVIAATIGAGCTNTPANGSAAPTPTTAQTQATLRAPGTVAPDAALEPITSRVQDALDQLDDDTATAAGALGPIGMNGNETRRVLQGLAFGSPAVIHATAVSRDGVMLTVEPDDYWRYEGMDISDREQVQRLRATQKPVMSEVYRTDRGVNATDLAYPVLTAGGQFNGSVSLLFQPAVLLTMAVQEALGGGSAEIFVMDTNGLVLYAQDGGTIGTNVLTDPLYTSNSAFLTVARRVAAEPEGIGSYTSAGEGSSGPVKTEVMWTSVGLHGAEWRVVAATASPGA